MDNILLEEEGSDQAFDAEEESQSRVGIISIHDEEEPEIVDANEDDRYDFDACECYGDDPSIVEYYKDDENNYKKQPVDDDEIVISGTVGGKVTISRFDTVQDALASLQQGDIDTVQVEGAGDCLATAVEVAEEVKWNRGDGIELHQITKLSSRDEQEIWEPLVEGLNPVIKKKMVNTITVTLSTLLLDTTHTGYQSPVTDADIQTDAAATKDRRLVERQRQESDIYAQRSAQVYAEAVTPPNGINTSLPAVSHTVSDSAKPEEKIQWCIVMIKQLMADNRKSYDRVAQQLKESTAYLNAAKLSAV